jgi:hypothetical protein
MSFPALVGHWWRLVQYPKLTNFLLYFSNWSGVPIPSPNRRRNTVWCLQKLLCFIPTWTYICNVKSQNNIETTMKRCYRPQLPRGLRPRSATFRLLRLWVRIPQVTWMSACFVCCVLSGRGLCDELITRPEESNRMWCVIVCDLYTSWIGRP